MKIMRLVATKPLLPAAALSVFVLLLAAWTEPSRETTDSTSPFIVAQAKADKGKAATGGQQINPGSAGTGKGTQCPPGKKPTFVPARGKGAGTFECM